MVRAYIALGSNLQDPLRQVTSAIAEMNGIRRSRLAARSSLFRTVPMGPQDQPDYVNAVVAIETALPALELLDELLGIERAHGRTRGKDRWGPRTLDLDLLLYGDERIDDPRLTIPHPGIAERAFVLYPLAEIAPQLNVPGKGPLLDLMRACPTAGIERIADHA